MCDLSWNDVLGTSQSSDARGSSVGGGGGGNLLAKSAAPMHTVQRWLHIAQDIQGAALRVRVEVNPCNFVEFGVGALNHKVTLPVSRPREPNVMAKVHPPCAAASSPELARALQNGGVELAQISGHDHVEHRQTKVI